ncbi:MAG: hypothetical protein ACMV1K_00180 [Sulfurospirillum sp.]
MNQAYFLEKQWIQYEKVCNEKGIDAGTKEDFFERQTPKSFKPDMLLDKRSREPILETTEHLTDTNVGEITPLLKTKKGDEYILTRNQLVEYLTKAYEAGRQSV